MENPYEVLGVNENASDDEVKSAYKELVKKYHPDKYQNNPLGDLAEEKMREVNEAYDYIMNIRKGRASSSYGYDGTRKQPGPEFMDIRRDIDANRLREAQEKLNRIQRKSAEWIFLDGMISYKKGWYDDAAGKIQQAVNMDPGNPEYNQALNTLMNAGQGYRNNAYGRGYTSDQDMLCTACQCFLCADCCCNGF